MDQCYSSQMDRCYSSVFQLFYLESKGKYIPEVWGHADPKNQREERERERERERPPAIWLLFLYVFFASPWTCCMYIGLVRTAVCSTWGPGSGPRIFLCSIFMGFSLPCLLATTILDCFSYSNYLTGDLSNPGIKPVLLTAPALAGGFLTTSATCMHIHIYKTRNWLTHLCRLVHPICRVCC